MGREWVGFGQVVCPLPYPTIYCTIATSAPFWYIHVRECVIQTYRLVTFEMIEVYNVRLYVSRGL